MLADICTRLVDAPPLTIERLLATAADHWGGLAVMFVAYCVLSAAIVISKGRA